MWRLLLGTMGVKSLVQGLNAAATAGFEPRTVWSEVRRCNRLATAPPFLRNLLLQWVSRHLSRERYPVKDGLLVLEKEPVVHFLIQWLWRETSVRLQHLSSPFWWSLPVDSPSCYLQRLLFNPRSILTSPSSLFLPGCKVREETIW